MSLLEPINILIFGMAGSSKSSFINSIYTMFQHDTIISTAGTQAGSDHCTKQYFKYEFEGLPFSIWDTWGITEENYQDFELTLMLQGKLPKKYDYSMSYDVVKKKFGKDLDATANERKIHQVIFFIPIGQYEDLQEYMVEHLRSINMLVPNPIIVLSLADSFDEKIRESPLLGDSKILSEAKKKITQKIGIPGNRIYYGVNYQNETKPSFEIDRNTFSIVYDAIKNAQLKQKIEKNSSYDGLEL
jgi:septin family protein